MPRVQGILEFADDLSDEEVFDCELPSPEQLEQAAVMFLDSGENSDESFDEKGLTRKLEIALGKGLFARGRAPT